VRFRSLARVAGAFLGLTLLTTSCGDGTTVVVDQNIAIALSGSTITIVQGSNNTLTVTLTRSGGFDGSVTLSATGLPSGVTASISPSPITSGTTSATVTLTATGTATTGTSTVTVHATATGISGEKTVTFTLIVNPAPAIALALSQSTLSLTQGTNQPITVTLTRTGGFAGAVDLTVEGATGGVSGAVSPTSIAAGSTSSTLTVTVTAAVPSISLAAAPTSLSLAQGATSGNTVTITLTRAGGFTGAVNLALTGAPAGTNGAFNPAALPTGTTSSTLTVNVGAATATGNYTLVVTASGTGVSNAVLNIALTVTQAPGFTIALNPTSASVAQGGNTNVTVTITRVGGFTGTVNLALVNPPANIGGNFNPAAVPNGTTQSALTLNVGAAAVAQLNALTIRASSNGFTDRDAVFNLTVTVAGNYTLALNPTQLTIVQGQNSNTTVNINRVGGFAGDVALAASNVPNGVNVSFNPALQSRLASEASVSGNSSVMTVSVGAAVTPGAYNITVTGTANGLANQTASLALTVNQSAGGGNIVYTFCAPNAIPI
jgi:uncharacterized membrane protein